MNPRRAVMLQAAYNRRLAWPETVATPAGQMALVADYLGRPCTRHIALAFDTPRSAHVIRSPGGRDTETIGIDGTRLLHRYDPAGRLEAIIGGRFTASFAYDGLSRVSSRTVTDDAGHTLRAEYEYDERGLMHATTFNCQPDDSVSRHVMTWRPDGKLETRSWLGVAGKEQRKERFFYDARGRLARHVIEADGASDFPLDEANLPYTEQRFEYDAIDNLCDVDTVLVDGRTDRARYGYDTTNPDRLVRVEHALAEYGPPRNLTYDADGNLLTDGRNHLAWTRSGRLASVTANGRTTRYEVGPDGRVSTLWRDGTATFRFHDADGLAFESTLTEQRSYLRAKGNTFAETALSGGIHVSLLLGTDHQGSVVVESDTTLRTRRFGAYGAHGSDDCLAHPAFTGEIAERDSGYYMLGDRLYDPCLRRFLSPDPASPFGAGGINRYAYCAGDPVNRIDPTGDLVYELFITALTALLTFYSGPFYSGAVATVFGADLGFFAAITTPAGSAVAASVVFDVASVAVEMGGVWGFGPSNPEEERWMQFGSIALLALGLGPARYFAKGEKAAKRVDTFNRSARAVGGRANEGTQRFINVVMDAMAARRRTEAATSASPAVIRSTEHSAAEPVSYWRLRRTVGNGSPPHRTPPAATARHGSIAVPGPESRPFVTETSSRPSAPRSEPRPPTEGASESTTPETSVPEGFHTPRRTTSPAAPTAQHRDMRSPVAPFDGSRDLLDSHLTTLLQLSDETFV